LKFSTASVHFPPSSINWASRWFTKRCPGNASSPRVGKPALEAHGDSRAVQQYRRFVSFAETPGRRQRVHDGDRAFEGYRVKRNKRLVTRIRLDIIEALFLVIHQKITIFVLLSLDFGHGVSPLEFNCRFSLYPGINWPPQIIRLRPDLIRDGGELITTRVISAL